MAWYAVYVTATGELVSVGQVVADPLNPSYSSKVLSGQPDFSTQMWDTVSLDFISKPSPTIISKVTFLDRFTTEEKRRFIMAKSSLFHYPEKIKRDIELMMDYLSIVDSIDKTEDIITRAVTSMESSGIIGQGRKNEILS